MKFNGVILVSSILLSALQLRGQHNYSIDLPVSPNTVIRGHLKLGGVNPQGDSISVNNYYIEKSGKPFIPVIGEFHFSRYPKQYWEESILKMKAGGLNVVASYVFWNIHEREEGKFDWSGNLDLRNFIELCGKHNLNVIIRIGPFGHGEMRNGGLPDWLYGRPFDVRSNDEGYLNYVSRFYSEISRHVHGKFYQDGGPIIGIQLENEFQHSAAPWEINYPGSAREYTVASRDINVTHVGVSISHQKNENSRYGMDHMNTLQRIANDAGMRAPLYTATGWGNAAIIQKGSIPVTAGYAYPFWAPAEPSPFYLYKDIHKNPDYSPVSFEPELYPSMPAELGSGIQVTYYRRPTVPPQSIEPLIVRTIGSGSNGIGYYMYHGGSTPVFEHFYSEETGGVPKINYDFQAPIGEFGDTRFHYHSLKTLHLFLASYGHLLAPMQTVLPESNVSIKPDDATTLRYAVRANGNSGFVFMHNFQDHVEVKDITNVSLSIKTAHETIRIPATGSFDLKKETTAILPFNLSIGGKLLKFATATPLTILKSGTDVHYVFVSNEGIVPEFLFDGKLTVKTNKCKAVNVAGATRIAGGANSIFSFAFGNVKILVLPKANAMTAYVNEGKLFLTKANLLFEGSEVQLISRGDENVLLDIYPKNNEKLFIENATISRVESDVFSSYSVRFNRAVLSHPFERVSEQKFVLRSKLDFKDLNDIFLKIDYTGDRAMAFFDGLLKADHLYYGQPWTIGLKRFKEKLDRQDMVFMLHPIQKDATYLVDFSKDKIPDFSKSKSFLEFHGVEFIPEYKAVFKIN